MVPIPLQVLDCPPLSETVAGSAVTVVVTIDTLQSLHLLHNLHRMHLYQSLVGQHVLLLGAAVQVCALQDGRNQSVNSKHLVINNSPTVISDSPPTVSPCTFNQVPSKIQGPGEQKELLP